MESNFCRTCGDRILGGILFCSRCNEIARYEAERKVLDLQSEVEQYSKANVELLAEKETVTAQRDDLVKALKVSVAAFAYGCDECKKHVNPCSPDCRWGQAIEAAEKALGQANGAAPDPGEEAKAMTKCTWENTFHDHCMDEREYHTDCGQCFEFYVNGPAENGFKFCPFCGKEVEELATNEQGDGK